jgi:arylsulfatase A-like enzyme
MEKEGFQGREHDTSHVGRRRHLHDPGIQQETKPFEFPYSRVIAAPWGDDNLHGEGERMKLGIFSMPSHPPERSLKDGHEWDLQNIIWADELGFEEFWIGEHHAMVWEPHPSPDLLVVEGFRETKNIRIGPGGFCLPYHHPAELANRIEWLWRWSRREVTHNHQRTTFAALLEDIHTHFETLRQHPDLVLRQIGSPFAEQGPAAQPLAYAA